MKSPNTATITPFPNTNNVSDKKIDIRSIITEESFLIDDKKDYEIAYELVYNYLKSIGFMKYSSFERGIDMDNNLLEKYIEKVDRDQSDLRADIRASEERTAKNLSDVHQRMDNRLNRIEDLISKQNDSFETKFNKLENKIDTKIDSLEGKIDENKKFMWGITISIVGLCIATIIGIATLV
jgi:hypothetical protein